MSKKRRGWLQNKLNALKGGDLAGPADPVESRAVGEGRKPAASGGKRRGRPPTGRTAVLSTTVNPAFKAKLDALAQARGIGVGLQLEQLIDELEALRVQVAILRGRARGRRA